MPFTPEELAAMRAADAEIDASFRGPTEEERQAAAERDREAMQARPTDRKDRREQAAAYRKEHREELNAKSLAYYHAHKDAIRPRRRAYYLAHKEEAIAYNREYRKRKKTGG